MILPGICPFHLGFERKVMKYKVSFLLSSRCWNKENVRCFSSRTEFRPSLFFSDWLLFLSAVCVKHGEEKRNKKKRQRVEKKRKTKLIAHALSGWQHSTNRDRVCAALRPMGEQGAREHCVLNGWLEEAGVRGRWWAWPPSQQCQGEPDELAASETGRKVEPVCAAFSGKHG